MKFPHHFAETYAEITETQVLEAFQTTLGGDCYDYELFSCIPLPTSPYTRVPTWLATCWCSSKPGLKMGSGHTKVYTVYFDDGRVRTGSGMMA